MASATDVIAAIEKFELDLIEKQWSDDIWVSEFTSCPDDISEEFDEKFSLLSYCDIVQVIEQADKIINLWLNNWIDTSLASDAESSNSSSVMGPSWTLLQEIDYKKLLSLLYFYICKGHVNNQDITSVHICVKATNFYFTLLIIPGSDIYKIFNPTLFEKCLETFSLHKFLEIATGRMIKKAKTHRKSEEFSSDDEFLEMDETLTLSQQQNVVKQLNFLLSTFKQFVNKFSFKKYPEALNMSLSILAELTRIERNSSLHEFSTSNVNTSFAPLSRNAYLVMKDFCSSLHGRIPEIIRLVLFYLMPNLTSIGGLSNPEINKLNHKELTNIRSIAVSFITENIIPLGEDAHLGLKILIQQLCFNMIDRADYRSKATDMVLVILSKLPMNLYYSLLKWIFRLSMIEGAHHRVISLELLSKLIFMKPGSEDMSKLTDSQYQHLDSQLQNSENVTATRSELHQKSDCTSSLSQEPIVSFSQPFNYVPLEYRRVMFAIIVDRIRDEASTVRTRALSILADIISNRSSQALQVILRDVFVHPYADCDEISLKPPIQENDFLKWKTFVTSLEKVHETEVAKNMFPGGKIIVKKVFEKCLDERVNVRKAALQVISNLFKLSSKWMTSENLQLFGKYCRDPALSIRKEMLNNLTELMLFFSGHKPLMELWVEEVVPLIMDREIRVQEQALQIFSNTILFKITPFNKIKNTSDELPWKLLDKIAEQNKRSFLMTACCLWSESHSFNQSLITTLKSHIGTVNNTPVWVLLASIAEYFEIEKPEFIMTYYMDVISKETGENISSYLALLTLSTSWQKLTREKKEILQAEMFGKLKSFSVSPIFVVLTVEIVTGITVYLAEDELAGKKEVAKWGIEMIQICEAHLESCLKAPRKNECDVCVNILAFFGALVGICPDKIKHPTFSLLFNYLMNSKNGGSSFNRKMKAITVVTLSKMALQSDHFARNLVPGLAQLLDKSTDPIVLNNVIVAIADIGESYANLIEPLIPFICVCMKSKYKGLKEITLVLLVELLQEDYLKARGALVFHLLTMINDPNSWLVNIVKFYFTNSLLARNPYKMYQLLLPGIFHFNDYTNHPDYPKLEMDDAEARVFDLSGPQNHSNRMNIYQFMLSNVPDMVRMKCLHFICTVILNGAADNIIDIKGKNGEQLLFDALCILLTPEIKIDYNDLVKKKNEDGEEEDDQKQNPLYKLGKQMFTTAQKREIIETIIPICCKLKKKLLVENKKLLPYLHKFVRELVKDYKSEVNEIFKEDKQFGIEILHELDKIANSEVEDDEDEEGLINAMVSESQRAGETPDPGNYLHEGAKEREASRNKGTLPAIPEQSTENSNKTHSSVQDSLIQNENSEMQQEQIDVEKQPSSNSEKQSDVLKEHLVLKVTDSESQGSKEKSAPERRDSLKQNKNALSDSKIQEEKSGSQEMENHNQLALRKKLEKKYLTVSLERLTSISQEEKSESQKMENHNQLALRKKVEEKYLTVSLERLTSIRQEKKSESQKMENHNQLALNKKPENKYLTVSLERLTSIRQEEKSESHEMENQNQEDLNMKSSEMKYLTVSLERLSTKYLKLFEKGKEEAEIKSSKSGTNLSGKSLRRNQREEKQMEKAMHNIIMPPPMKTSVKSKKQSLTKSIFNKTPTTPLVEVKQKELLTSTPLVAINKSDFDMDISAVVDES